jgi:dTDP-4-dehydrorhamnose 3,5-epimerase
VQKTTKLEICDLRIVRLQRHADSRGSFLKLAQIPDFENYFKSNVAEVYMSVSKKNVIRGMHLQSSPHGHRKIVACTEGKLIDVVVDLRRDSPSYRKFDAIELSADEPTSLWIPEGCAHGFLALADSTALTYLVNSLHIPEADTGIRWDSFGYNWPVSSPILSQRDASLPLLDEWK